MNYLCAVCGYDRMERPPESFHICPCCGTEFELDDHATSHAELRKNWVLRGSPWFSRATPSPPNWDWREQLKKAGLDLPITILNGVAERPERPEAIWSIPDPTISDGWAA